MKRAPLADYRIVYFATHGLVAGDVKGVAEPSLSLPSQPSDLDDGLLTASEVAQLKLNADWVVLSACNTIAGDKPGAEAGRAEALRQAMLGYLNDASSPQERLSGLLGAVCPDQGRGGALESVEIRRLCAAKSYSVDGIGG